MTLNENTIRELLEQATPGPWNVAMLDLHRDTGVIDNEHAQSNQRLAALAPELAAAVIRLHEAIDFIWERWDTLSEEARREDSTYHEGFMDGLDYAIGTITRITRIMEDKQ